MANWRALADRYPELSQSSGVRAFDWLHYVGSGACICQLDYNESWISETQYQAAALQWPELCGASSPLREGLSDKLVNNFHNFQGKGCSTPASVIVVTGADFFVGYHLVAVGLTIVNPSFQKAMRQLFGSRHTPAPVKTAGECFAVVKDLGCMPDAALPRAACVLDICSCTIEFHSPGALLEGFELLSEHSELARCENGFSVSSSHQVCSLVVNLIHNAVCQQDGLTYRMACEARLQLAASASTVLLPFYQLILNANGWDNEALHGLVGPECDVNSHLGRHKECV